MKRWREPSKETYVWVFYMLTEDPFIFAIEGLCHSLVELEREIQDFEKNGMDYFPHGNGEYLFKAVWNLDEGEFDGFWEVESAGFKLLEH